MNLSMRSVARRSLISCVALVGSTALCSTALASGFLTARFGGEHGHPTTDSPSAMYYNPAGLALGRGTRLNLDGTFAWIAAGYERTEGSDIRILPDGQAGSGTPASAVDRNAGKNSLLNFAAAPFLGVVSDFGIEGLGVGLGAYVPFGGASTWDQVSKFDGDPDYPGAVDGAQRWWSIEGTLRSLYATAAGAYKIPSTRLSLGLSFNYIMSEIHTVRARNGSGGDELVSVNADGDLTVQEGRSLIDVKNKSVSVGAGLIYEPIDDLWLGLSYQSQPGFGEMKYEGDLKTVLGTGASSTTDIFLYQQLPDVMRFGARYRPSPKHEVRFSAEYARWSVFERQCLVNANPPAAGQTTDCDLSSDGAQTASTKGAVSVNIERDWEDAMAFRAGYSHFLSDDLELMGSLGYDGNAVPDATLDPAIPDFHDVAVGVGARYELLEDKLALAGTYTQFFYVPREIDQRPRNTDANGVSNSDPLFDPPSAQPDAAGKYTRSIGAFNLNVQYTF